ncbi:MAG: protein methyltransferase [Thermoprotei archaeon]|nr:MAG: protein methyltransferase [Thermoprotei archaeon]
MSNEYLVKEGSKVLIYIDGRRKRVINVRKDGRFESDKGVLLHKDIIEKPYGSKVTLSTGYKAYLLDPLITDYLMHGYRRATQVIYPKDLGFIALLSGISSGSIVVEGGTGTGFLTSVLAHYVRPNGKVFTYEVRNEFLEVAKKNLRMSGLDKYVVFKNKDIREGIDEKEVDAVFLDIPDPWNALDAVYKALKPSKPLITFLPTVNQIEKLYVAVRNHGGFIDFHAYELMLRELQVVPGKVRPQTLMIAHTGYVVFTRKVIKE